MSTNKTPNYNLHSWVAGDEFHVSEINENFTLLDTALKAEAQTLTALSGETLRLCSGQYSGSAPLNTDASVTIDLGVQPRVVFITTISGYNPYDLGSFGGLATQEHPMRGLTLTDTGFIAANRSPPPERKRPYLYLSGPDVRRQKREVPVIRDLSFCIALGYETGLARILNFRE